ncbi:OmpA family protein [Kiloniella sp. EL199]|uniref:OmpA family protein n=1 Tax=Kiloniella sp. EL199 TaxID=2107581 RepID=UPI000EA273E6|nr:OmpA family protein [Kiloniella sp. EL199]
MVKFVIRYLVPGCLVLGVTISTAMSSPVDCSVPVDQNPLVKKVIYFDVGQSSLSKKAQKKIDDLFDVVDGHPSLKICAIGQADKQGDPEANKKLSLKRAQSAKNYLVKKGIAKKRIETVFRGEAYGSFSLWGTGDKADEDRRVEVIAYKE